FERPLDVRKVQSVDAQRVLQPLDALDEGTLAKRLSQTQAHRGQRGGVRRRLFQSFDTDHIVVVVQLHHEIDPDTGAFDVCCDANVRVVAQVVEHPQAFALENKI